MKALNKTLILILAFVFITGASLAQQNFSKIYYSDPDGIQSYGVAKTFDQTYLIAGNFNGYAALIKIDSMGEVVWNRKFEPYSFSEYSIITALNDSNYLFVAEFQNYDTDKSNLLCAKITTDGELIWVKTYFIGNYFQPYSVSPTFDGGAIICGSISNYNNTPYHTIALAKIGDLGDLKWSKEISQGNNANFAYSMKQTADSGYILTGFVEDINPLSITGFLTKMDPTGNIMWSRQYFPQPDSLNIIFDLLITENGYRMLMLSSDGLMILDTDKDGVPVWSMHYDINNFFVTNQPFYKLLKTSDNNFAVLAPDVLMKIDNSGEVSWATHIEMYVTDVVESNDNGFFITGNGPVLGVKMPESYNLQIGVIKTDSNGENDSECLNSWYIPTNEEITITSASILFDEELIGSMTETEFQITSNDIAVEERCVAFIGALDDLKPTGNPVVFPNPASSEIHVEFDSPGTYRISITNVTGQILFEKSTSQAQMRIDLSEFSNGIYFVIVNTNEKYTVQKLIKK